MSDDLRTMRSQWHTHGLAKLRKRAMNAAEARSRLADPDGTYGKLLRDCAAAWHAAANAFDLAWPSEPSPDEEG